MRIKKIFPYVQNLLRVKLLKKRVPLFIGWDITHQCNCSCLYCDVMHHWSAQLSTEDILYIIDDLAALGLRHIHFGGGEPLLREDLGVIIEHCKNKNITLGILTNGILFAERLDWLKKVDLVKISLDGPASINDILRNREGHYDEVIGAVKVARKYGIRVSLNTTLTRKNLEYAGYLVELAYSLGITVKFQPVNMLLSGDKDIKEYIPSPENFKDTISQLIQMKKKGYGRTIVNSQAGLGYLSDYPHYRPMACCAGRMFFRIDPVGSFYCCSGMMSKKTNLPVEYFQSSKSLKEIIESMPIAGCDYCACTSTLELNLIYSGKLSAIFDAAQYL
ncbi:MAG: radical SAM protein [Candidatus Omnitrophica bacterium]|nr:radical SAM protein [Candidatus Omnitrophota bacterium]